MSQSCRRWSLRHGRSVTRRLPSATRTLVQNERLRYPLHQLQRAQFGRRSEKLDPDQLNLAFEDIKQAIAGTEADDDKKDSVAARHHGAVRASPSAAWRRRQ